MKNYLIGGLVLFLVLGSGIFYSLHNEPRKIENSSMKNFIVSIPTNSKITQKQNHEKFETVVSHADFSKLFNSVDELVQDSDIIIEGTVLSTSSFNFGPNDNSIVYTKAPIKVTKVLRGNVKVGDILTFVEPGGITTKKALGMGEKFPETSKEELSKKVKVLFDGAPNMRPHKKLLLFANDESKFSEKNIL